MKYYLTLVYLLVYISTLGAQIPSNPFAPASSWPEGHGVYGQQNTFTASLTEMDSIVIDTINLPPGFTGFFPTGTITTELNTATNTYNYWGTNGKAIYKVVCSEDSTTVISELGSNLGGNNFVSGYWLMDADEKGYFLSDYKLLVLNDDPLDPYSDISTDSILDLSDFQVQGLNDDLWAIKLLYSGELIITSSRGNIFVVNRNTLEILDHVLLQGDSLINSMVVDELNHVYINTKQELIKFRWSNGALSEVWNLNLGESGSTPTLVGSSLLPTEEQFIAVTDKSNVMNLVLVFRDEIPSNWSGIPNYPLRVAAVEPIDFNVQFPAFNVRPTQNSLLVKDHSFLLARWDNLFPTANAYKPGLEKWTWNPASRSLSQDWVNEEIYIPNSMQALSANGYLYAIGQRQNLSGEKYWCFKGMDWDSGAERISIDLASHSDSRFNTKGSGIQIGPFGDVITMSPDMILRFRKFNDPITSNSNNVVAKRIKVFPNPVNSMLNVKVADEMFNVEIFDWLGRQLYRKSNCADSCQINTTDFTGGNYIIRIIVPRTGEGLTQKIIIM